MFATIQVTISWPASHNRGYNHTASKRASQFALIIDSRYSAQNRVLLTDAATGIYFFKLLNVKHSQLAGQATALAAASAIETRVSADAHFSSRLPAFYAVKSSCTIDSLGYAIRHNTSVSYRSMNVANYHNENWMRLAHLMVAGHAHTQCNESTLKLRTGKQTSVCQQMQLLAYLYSEAVCTQWQM